MTPLAVGMMVTVGAAPLVSAQPEPPPPPVAAVPSGPPGILKTPDGWELTVAAKDEKQEGVAPLTTALSSREYLVDGTFTGSVKGNGSTKLAGGQFEAGYQIGCGIVGGPVELTGGIGLTPTLKIPFTGAATDVGFGGTIVSGQIKIGLRPGVVNIVPVGKKEFKGTDTRITITGFRVKVDGCVGQSFIRSYATFTSSTENTDDVVTYLGVTKVI